MALFRTEPRVYISVIRLFNLSMDVRKNAHSVAIFWLFVFFDLFVVRFLLELCYKLIERLVEFLLRADIACVDAQTLLKGVV